MIRFCCFTLSPLSLEYLEKDFILFIFYYTNIVEEIYKKIVSP